MVIKRVKVEKTCGWLGGNQHYTLYGPASTCFVLRLDKSFSNQESRWAIYGGADQVNQLVAFEGKLSDEQAKDAASEWLFEQFSTWLNNMYTIYLDEGEGVE